MLQHIGLRFCHIQVSHPYKKVFVSSDFSFILLDGKGKASEYVDLDIAKTLNFVF